MGQDITPIPLPFIFLLAVASPRVILKNIAIRIGPMIVLEVCAPFSLAETEYHKKVDAWGVDGEVDRRIVQVGLEFVVCAKVELAHVFMRPYGWLSQSGIEELAFKGT